MEAHCLSARCHGNTLTLAAEMLQSELIPPVCEETPQAFRCARAGFSSVTFTCSHVFVHAHASAPRLCTLSLPNMLSATGDSTNSQVLLLPEQQRVVSLVKVFRSKRLMMSILAECGGRVYLQTGWGGWEDGWCWGGGSLITETASVLSLCAVISASDHVSLVAV